MAENDYTAAEISAVIDTIVTEQREAIGTVGAPRLACMFEGADGHWVTTEPITDMEHWLVLVALYGEERAAAMRSAVRDSRSAGNTEHDLGGM